jgi:capsular polysaccharide biosynthesis protein
MTELRTPPRRELPDFDAEEEVDLSRYGRALASRWWLPVLGLVLGVVAGYLISLGSGKVYEAETTVFVGQPFSPAGSAPVQGLATNPRTVGEIVRSEEALRQAAARSGMRVGQLRGNVSTKQLSAGRGAARTGQNQLVEIKVIGDAPRKTQIAANTLAERVVAKLSPYVDRKIRAYESRLEAVDASIASTDTRVAVLNRAVARAEGSSTFEQLFLVSQLDSALQRRAQLVDQQAETEQLLALAEFIEKPQVVDRAVARKTTARSARNTMIVVGLIGLLLGTIAAVAWEPLTRRLNR